MLLEIITNGEKVNTFTGKETLSSLLINLWAHDQKTGTVKKMTVKPGKTAQHVNISFALNNSTANETIYNYIDVPYGGGFLDASRLLEMDRPARWIVYRTAANPNGWYKCLFVNITEKIAVYESCGSVRAHYYDNEIKVKTSELKELKAAYEKAGYEMKEL